MNDEFLSKYHKTPRAEFAVALYESISRKPQPRFFETIAIKLTFRNAAVAFMFVLLVAACVYAVTEKRWNKVGDIWVQVERTHKVDYIHAPFMSELEAQYNDLRTQAYECLTVEEARKMLRFEFKVPAWVPEGFTFDDRMCGVDSLSDYASLHWSGADEFTGITIYLANLRSFNMATQKYVIGPAAIWWPPVAPGSYEEVQVNGQPAVLVRGDWDLNDVVSEIPPGRELDADRKLETKWDKKRALQLYWVDGEVLYDLYTRAKVYPEDLIKMAESAQ